MVSEHEYAGVVVAGRRFVIIRHDQIISRIREVMDHDNRVIWQTGMAMTDEVLRIIKAAEPPQGFVLKASVYRKGER